MSDWSDGWDARDLLAYQFPPIDWLIETLLPAGLTFLVARSKAGKSWMMLSFGVACGFKRAWVLGGKYRIAPCGVLYLDLEMSARGSQKRLRKVIEFYERAGMSEVPILMRGFNSWPKLGDGGLEKLTAHLDEHPEVRLVVIDTIAKLWPRQIFAKGRNAYYVEYDLLSQLKRVADDRSIAIVCLHHQNKSDSEDPLDKASGTAALPAVADAIWLLERPKNYREQETKTATLFVTGREVAERTIDLEWDMFAGWVAKYDPLLNAPSEERQWYA